MKAARLVLVAGCLAALMVPLVYAIWFIGPTNFIATHGGNVTFAQNFQASSLTYPDGLNRFTNMIWNGQNLGTLGFDVDAGANMTVTAITRDTVTYTIITALPGNIVSYLYYWRNVNMAPHLSEPTAVTGGTHVYDAPLGMVNVTTTGSPRTIVVTYGYGMGASENIIEGADVLIMLIPFLTLAAVIGDARGGELGPGTLTKIVLIVVALSAFAWIIRGWGY